MPIIAVGPLPGRGLDFGKITECKSKLKWQAKSNYKLDTPQQVYQQCVGQYGLPIIPYTSTNPIVTAPIQLCRSVSCEQDTSAPLRWIIEATYSSEPLKGSDEEQAENPLARPPSIKWSSQQYRIPIFRDYNGKALVNSAGDYFDPPVEVDSAHWVVSIEKNVQAIPAEIIDYTNSINSNTFQIQGIGIGRGVARITDISLSERQTAKLTNASGQEITIFYYTFGYSLELHPESWDIYILNQGFQKRESTGSSNVIRIMDASTPPRPISSPALLELDGTLLADPSPENCRFIQFSPYRPRDFSILPGLLEAGA